MADKTNKKKKSNAPKVELRSAESETKPSAEEVDEFVSGANRWAAKLKPHATKIIAGLLLVIGAGIAWAVFSYMGDRKAEAATSAFAEAVDESRRPIVDATEEPPATSPEPGEEPEKTFPDRAARATATIAALGGAGQLTAAESLLRAQALLVEGQFDDAARAFGKASKGLPLEGAVQALAGIGYAYEAKAEATDDATAREQALLAALDAFKQMQPAEEGYGRDESLFHQARINATLGKRDEATALYEQILENHGETELKPDIEARLVALGAK